MTFDDAFDALLVNEVGHDPANPSGYVDDPRDPGGATCWGVTEATARAHGYTGDMRDYPRDSAKAVALTFWNAAHCDQIPDPARFEVFDMAFNASPREATILLQRALSVYDDGAAGPQTFAAIAAADPHVLRDRFDGYRLLYYVSLKNEQAFLTGWVARVGENLIRH